MAQTPPRVIFTHIPKTAGTTMRSVLYRQYQQTLFSLYGLMNESDVFAKLTEASRTTPDTVRAVSAHIPYGIHNYLTGESYQYFTILREPVKRAMSAYFYMRQLTNHPRNADAMQLTIVEYIQRYPFLGTVQTRYLLGMPQQNPEQILDSTAPLPENALDIAKEHLANEYATFGLTERFDESLLLLREAFGWRNIYYESQNITKSKRDNLTPETMDALRQACAIDIALYDYAKGLFEQRLQQQFGDHLPAMLQTFQRNNRIYNQLRRVKNKTIRVVARLKR